MWYRSLMPAMLASAFVLAPTAASAAQRAVAEFIDTQGRSIGQAELEETPHGVLLTVSVDGLSPGPKGFHIHDRGTCEDPEAEFEAARRSWMTMAPPW
jgi:superoxide dismutase, Cu-Zn family